MSLDVRPGVNNDGSNAYVRQTKKVLFLPRKNVFGLYIEISHENKLDFDVFIPKTTATRIYIHETNNGVINQMAL